MAKLFNRAKMDTSTTGSGTITLGSAVEGYQSFADAGVADSDVVQYVIEDGSSWEIGTGTYSATGTSLTRTPSESSNAGAAISLTGAAEVFITAVADDLNRLQNAGTTKVEATSTGATVTGDLAVTGTVDGRDIASDGSKLDGIESGATADQSASEILTAIKTVDGSGSGLDADTLDSYHATDFVGAAGDTMTGDLLVQSDIKATGQIRATGWWNTNTGTTGSGIATEIGVSNGEGYILSYNRDNATYGDLNFAAVNFNFDERGGTTTIEGNEIWHAGNDGSGSGLDADTVDGLHESTFMRKSANAHLNMNNYTLQNVNDITFNDPGPNEGLRWLGGNDWRIYESPDDLTTNSAGNLQFVTNTTRRMTLDTSGNLNISNSLTVGSSTSSNIYMTDTDNTTRRIHCNSNRIGFLNSSNGWGAYCDNNGNWIAPNFYVDGSIYHNGDTDTRLLFDTNTITLQTGGSSEITVNTTGVRLGDTGNGYFQPISGNYGSIQIDGGAHGGWEGYSIGGRAVFMHNNSTATGIYNDVNNEWLWLGYNDGASHMYYNGSSKVSTSSTGCTVTGDLNSTSDIRYKKNIKTIDGALEKVKSLRGVTFDWDNDAFPEDENSKKPNFTERATGVIAQDVEKVLPEAVRENEETGFKNVAYGNMVGLLIEAIKEQQTQIDALTAQVEELKR